ncbi:MAG: 4Fe-4S dicluster domain-containing protein [Candidatus Omnitrophica bacterium]|nr:4Fe-4S dicluster domain-containing protein [Candidatus Omnitrophota bacterium]
MPHIKIKKEKCKSCELCVVYCPRGLLNIDKVLNKKGYRAVSFKENSGCTGCSFCAIVCPEVAIEVFKNTDDRKQLTEN